jgi:hypothetical protein
MLSGRNGYTYLKAYCCLREEERTFRVDRILSWELAADAYTFIPNSLDDVVCVENDLSTNAGSKAFRSIGANKVSQVSEDRADLNTCALSSQQCTPACNNTITAPQRKHRFFKSIVVASCLFGFFRLIGGRSLEDIFDFDLHDSATRLTALNQPVEENAEISKMASSSPTKSVPLPKPKPSVRCHTYRGVTIKEQKSENGSTFIAEGLKITSSLRKMQLAVNGRDFRMVTGIDNSSLEKLYAEADIDKDCCLSWSEIKGFQAGLTYKFRYLANSTALRPDEFLEAGGGDCEDWALITCGLMRYWGYKAYVGCMAPPGNNSGHAICLIPQTKEPAEVGHYFLQNPTTVSGKPLPPGYYVPVDYEQVGRLSMAVGKNWTLKRIYEPEAIYGNYM